MNESRVIELLENAEYRFAKTAKSRNPHWYTLRDTWKDDKKFLQVAQFIRDNGRVEWFWKLKYFCFHHKGWKWWTMHSELKDVVLINKTFVSEQYNDIANKYDSLFKDKKYIEENKEIVDMLKPHLYDVGILDIGSGTGLLLDMFTLKPEYYTGIDPSYVMVKISRSKYPHHNFKVDKLETYNGYTHICVSLFGCMNYVLPDYLKRVYELSKKHFLMFYKEDYDPVTYKLANHKIYNNKYDMDTLKNIFIDSDVNEWKDYYIIKNI